MPANHCIPHTEDAKAKIRAARLGKPAEWKRRPSKIVDGVIQYSCGKCKGFFPFDGFYANKRTLLGIKSECKSCHTATAIASRDPENARKLNSAHMMWARKADPQKFQARDKEASRLRGRTQKTDARAALNNAVKRGQIVRPLNCEVCGLEKRLAGHHDDYSLPLVVRWLCYGCHGKEHRIVEFKRVTS